MKAINLKVEYLKNPVGIDISNPRFMWNAQCGIRQIAYRILAGAEGRTVWDSDRVESSRMTYIPYCGKAASRERIEWKVRLWDENGEEGDWSETAFFEMGLLNPEDWKAGWIAGDYKVNKKERYPVDCFRKNFEVENVVKARLYATACGLYEGRLNGQRVGSFVLAPGHTDYRKRIQYQTYDVTELVKKGETN